MPSPGEDVLLWGFQYLRWYSASQAENVLREIVVAKGMVDNVLRFVEVV